MGWGNLRNSGKKKGAGGVLRPPPASLRLRQRQGGPVKNLPRSSSPTQRLQQNVEFARTRCAASSHVHSDGRESEILPLFPHGQAQRHENTNLVSPGITAPVLEILDPAAASLSQHIAPQLS